MKILIVDDDSIHQKMFPDMLKGYYYTCDIAKNGFEALDLVTKSIDNKDNYDVIFLDIMMPEIDGHETLTRIRQLEIDKDVVDAAIIVMVTALDNKNDILSSFTEGCEYYLVKPIDSEKLLEIMDDIKTSRGDSDH